MDNRRIRVGVIIIRDGKLVAMYRKRHDREYYTFPGGGKNDNESEVECAKREVYEEYGINIEPIRKVYIYESKRSIEHYYLADWADGEFGTGQGEEYEQNNPNGIYEPMMIDISSIDDLPLMPPEVAREFLLDYRANGSTLRQDVKVVFEKN